MHDFVSNTCVARTHTTFVRAHANPRCSLDNKKQSNADLPSKTYIHKVKIRRAVNRPTPSALLVNRLNAVTLLVA